MTNRVRDRSIEQEIHTNRSKVDQQENKSLIHKFKYQINRSKQININKVGSTNQNIVLKLKSS